MDQYKSTPIVLLSSSAGFESEHVNKKRYAATLSKPVRREALLQTISGIAKKEAASPEPVAAKVDKTLGLSVLLAEDNTINQTVAIALLKKLGCDVTVASNGLEAVEIIKQANYDAVLMDCQMPIMDGFEATREIRSLDAKLNRHTPIIALTAIAMQGDRERCLHAGMDDYVPKPIRPDELRAALTRWSAPADASFDASNGGSWIDRNGLLERCSGDIELAQIVVDQFCQSLPGMIEELERAVTGLNPEEIHTAAHTLKGAAMTVGALKITEVALDLEKSAFLKDLSRANDQMGAIRQRIDSFLAEPPETLLVA